MSGKTATWESLRRRSIAGVGELVFERSNNGVLRYRLQRPDGSTQRLTSFTSLADQVFRRFDGYQQGARNALVALQRDGHAAEVDADAFIARNFSGERMRENAHWGSRVHELVAAYLAGRRPASAETAAERAAQNVMRWLHQLDARVIPGSVERLTCHPGLGYAGRTDLRVQMGGQELVLDIKTHDPLKLHRRPALAMGAHVAVEMLRLADEACGAPPGRAGLLFARADGCRFVHTRATPATVESTVAFYRSITSMATVFRGKALWDELERGKAGAHRAIELDDADLEDEDQEEPPDPEDVDLQDELFGPIPGQRSWADFYDDGEEDAAFLNDL